MVNMLYSRKKNFDSHVHFKCSHKDTNKKISLSRNIKYHDFVQALKTAFECDHEHTISCNPSLLPFIPTSLFPDQITPLDEDSEKDWIFIKNQADLLEGMIEYEKTSSLTLYFMDAHESRREYKSEKRGSFQNPPPIIVKERIHWVQGELLGSGACGNVYLGLNVDTGQLMAVKQVEHNDKGARGVSQAIPRFGLPLHPNPHLHLGILACHLAHEGDGIFEPAASPKHCRVHGH